MVNAVLRGDAFVPVAAEPGIGLPERRRELPAVGLVLSLRFLEIAPRGGDELLLVGAGAHSLGPDHQLTSHTAQMVAGLGDDPEVDQGEPLERPPLDLIERVVPSVEIGVRRRRDGKDVAGGLDPDADGIAGEERSVLNVGDVV